MKRRHQGWLILAIAFGLLTVVGCTRTVTVTEQMTWECAPEENKPAMGMRADEYVRFRYVKEPRCFEVESSQDFCARMQALGKRVVSVQIRVWGGPKPFARQGYDTEAIEGQPLIPGTWGHSGINGDAVCPISKVIDSLDWAHSRGR